MNSAKLFIIGAIAILFLTVLGLATKCFAVNRLNTDWQKHMPDVSERELTADQRFIWQEITPFLTADKSLCVKRYFQFSPLASPHASAHYCLYSTFFLPWIRSTPAEAVATSTMPVEASPCSTSNGSRVPHNRFVRRLWRWRRPHLYYWKIPIVGLAILGLKFIFIGVISPKNYFIFRWECRLIATQMWNNFGWLRTEILLKIEIKFSWLTLSLKSWRIN